MMYERYADQTKPWDEPEQEEDVDDLSGITIRMNAPGPFYIQSWPIWSGTAVDYEPADPPEVPVERSETPIVGYRSWDVSRYPKSTDSWHTVTIDVFGNHHVFGETEPKPEPEGPYRLWSPVQGTEWTGPILRADGKPCPYDPHAFEWQGREDHCHGIYAHDEPAWGDYHQGRAIGRLEATGTVVVHEHGFRAEAVRITQLVLAPNLIGTEARRDIERIYGCDVTYNPEELVNGHR